MSSNFHYELNVMDGYISDRLWGQLEEDDLATSTAAAIKLSDESGVKRILYDADQLVAGGYEVRKQEVEYARQLQEHFEKLATFTTNRKIEFAGNVIYQKAGIKNARIFTDKAEAIAWLKAK